MADRGCAPCQEAQGGESGESDPAAFATSSAVPNRRSTMSAAMRSWKETRIAAVFSAATKTGASVCQPVGRISAHTTPMQVSGGVRAFGDDEKDQQR